jgi:gliding motility-associated-like protein
MKRIYLQLFLIINLIVVNLNVFASHVPGGNITYECLEPNKFVVTLKIFEDCQRAFIANSAQSIDVTNGCPGLNFTNNSSTFSLPNVSYRQDITQLCAGQLSNSQCNGGTEPGVYMSVWRDTITLPGACASWVFSYDDCCRDASSNLNGTGNHYYWEAKLNSFDSPCNSSPTITADPIPTFCVGTPAVYNLGIFEPDGDNLLFELIGAKTGQSTTAPYQGTFTALSPIPGITINSTNGELSFTPPNQGNYVINILITEFNSAGVEIGSIVHDFQIEVVAGGCNNTAPSPPAGGLTNVVNGTLSGLFIIDVCAGSNVCFDVEYTDNLNDSVIISSNIEQLFPGATMNQTSFVTNGIATFCFTPTATSNPLTSISINVKDNACPTVGISSSVVNVLLDVDGPVFNTCPADQNNNYDANCQFAIPDYTALANVSDACDPNPIITQSPSIGSTVTSNSLITLTATDNLNNSTNCTFNLILTDNINPVINCLNDNIIYLDNTCTYTLLDYTAIASTTDNCDPNPSFTQSPAAGTSINSNTTITLTSTDATGNSANCTFDILLNDTISPVINNCPADQIDHFDNNCNFTILDYSSLILSSDNCNGIPVISQTPAVGSIVNSDALITLTATDTAGNQSNCSFNLIITDTISPSFVCLPDDLDYFDNNCQFTLIDYTQLINVTDNCDPTPNIVQSPAPGTSLTTSTVISFTATDLSGNTKSCSFNLTLTDSIIPIIICPNNTTGYLDANCQYVLLNVGSLANVNDNCGAPNVLQDPPIGTILNSDTIIKLTATDIYGNIDSCIYNITILDTISPQINCLPDQIDYNNLNSPCSYIIPDYTDSLTYSDNCDNNLLFTQNPLPGIQLLDDTNITITVTDNSGNFSTCDFILSIRDTILPLIACPSDTILNNDSAQCGAIYNYSYPVGSDNCPSSISQISGLPAGSLFPVGFTNNFYRITDYSGNYTNCSFYVLVKDIDIPLIECINDTSIEYNSSCEYLIPDFTSQILFSDNCGIHTIVQSPKADSIITNDYTMSFVITDSSGNVNSCGFNIDLFDPNVQNLTCPNDQSIMLDMDCEKPMPDFSDQLLVPSLCGSVKTVSQSPEENFIIDFVGKQDVVFTILDSLGNIETCSFELTSINNDQNNCYQIYIPNIFSPDGDLINDELNVYGLQLDGLGIEIYSRWGEMVYKSNLNEVSWDGNYQGKPLPEGSYVYRVFYLDGKLKHKGTISLIR